MRNTNKQARIATRLFRDSLCRTWLLVLLWVTWPFSALATTAGSLDTAFNPGTGPNGTVYAVITQPNGKILVGGSFTSFNGLPRQHMVRLNTDGSVDSTFSPNIDGAVRDILLQADGKVIVGGWFMAVNGMDNKNIARLEADGTVDTAFNVGTGSDDDIFGLTLQPDGKIVVFGMFWHFADTFRRGIARLNTDGSLDTAFAVDIWQEVTSVMAQPDGKLVIAGPFGEVNGISRFNLARLHADGSVDTSFDTSGCCGIGPESYPNDMVVQPDGKVIIAANVYSLADDESRTGIARYNADGSLDTAFTSGLDPSCAIGELALQPDGKILIDAFCSDSNFVARLAPDGSVDTSFNAGIRTGWPLYALALQTDGKLLAVGDFTDYNSTSVNRIIRIHTGNSDGDAVQDGADAFPLNPSEQIDTDFDGTGNNADLDDDNDGVPDYIDAEPLNAGNASEIILPVNGGYKGSRILDGAAFQ